MPLVPSSGQRPTTLSRADVTDSVVVSDLVDVNAQVLPDLRRYPQRRSSGLRWHDDGVPHPCVVIGHPSEQLPVERVHVKPRLRGPALRLGVEHVSATSGGDVDPQLLTAYRPTLAFQPCTENVHDTSLVTSHTATVLVQRRPGG